MKHKAKWPASVACLLTLTGVMMAALGSHLVDLEAVERGVTIWQTASTLHLFEAAAILALTAWLQSKPSKSLLWACWLLILGTIVFCGSLYMRVASGGNLVGAAPAGGMMMMAGWLLAAWGLMVAPKS